MSHDHSHAVPSTPQQAVVLGAAGLVGQLLGKRLSESGSSVVGIDLAPRPAEDRHTTHWLVADAAALSDSAGKALSTAEAVFICLPEPVALAALPALLDGSHEQALIVDTLSVKGPVLAALKGLRPGQEYLSINPLFSPKIGFAGQNVAVVEIQGGPRAAAFLSLLQAWGAHATLIDAQQHDQVLALIQVATHAALLTLGMTLNDWGYDVTQALTLGTPPHRITLALLARMSDAAPEVYWDIQHSNPHSAQARNSLAEALRRLSNLVESGDQHGFEDCLRSLAATVQPLRDELLKTAEKISAASRLDAPTPSCLQGC